MVMGFFASHDVLQETAVETRWHARLDGRDPPQRTRGIRSLSLTRQSLDLRTRRLVASRNLSLSLRTVFKSRMGRADDDIDVRLLSFLQFFVGPRIDRPGLLEIVCRRDESFDLLPACSDGLKSGPSFDVKNPSICFFSFCAVGLIAPSGEGCRRSGLCRYSFLSPLRASSSGLLQETASPSDRTPADPSCSASRNSPNRLRYSAPISCREWSPSKC